MGRLRYLCAAALLIGCSRFGSTPTPQGEGGTGGAPTVCAEDELFDGECNAAPPCCVKGPAKPFEGLSWFAIGTPDTVGSCPNPTTEGLTGYADIKPASHTCGACSCSPAACTLPEGIHTNAAKCADADGSIAVPLGPDPAAGWEGVCSEEGALPADLQCGGEPCAQSISFPTMPVSSCKPESSPGESFPDPEWGRMARQCVIEPLSGEACPEENQVCAPRPPEGFVLCLYVKAEEPTCPWEYPVREMFYRNVKDERGCGLCECSDPPVGAQCMALFQIFSDAVCSALEGAVVVTDQEAACVDVVSGTALGSAEASMLIDIPGSCTSSGGMPFGDVQPAEPLTLCCQGAPDPPG